MKISLLGSHSLTTQQLFLFGGTSCLLGWMMGNSSGLMANGL